MLPDPVTALALGLLCSFVLLDAGLHKWREPLHYAAVIDEYRLLPQGAGRWLSRPLGATECLLGAAVLLPPLRGGALAVAAALLLGYALAIGINLLRGRRDIDCGCGAPEQAQPLSPALILRNLLLAAAAGLAGAAGAEVPAHWSGWAFALLAALAGALLYASVNGLLANRQYLERLR